MDPTYYDLSKLLADDVHPLHRLRGDAIIRAYSGDKDYLAEPLTITVKDYIGGGDLRYSFPNGAPTHNISGDGYLHSLYKGRDTWRFFKEPMFDLGKLSGTTIHLLCVRFRPEDSKQKDCYPLCVVEFCPEDLSPQSFSKRNARYHQDGHKAYIEYCASRNATWIAGFPKVQIKKPKEQS